MSASCEALVLAAGTGARIGGPKALLEYKGVPLLAAHVERALDLGIAHVSTIVRPEVADVLAPRLEQYGDKLSLIRAQTDSQASSLAVLVRALAAKLEGDLTFLITPVDVLPCSPTVYRALVATLEPGTLAATPSFQHRGGHPVLVRSALLAPCLEGPLETSPTLRDLLRGDGVARKKIEVGDASILSDLDTHADAAHYGLTTPW